MVHSSFGQDALHILLQGPQQAHSALSRRRAVTFVVSDFLGDGYEHALRLAAARHDIVPVASSGPDKPRKPSSLRRSALPIKPP